MTNLLLSFAAIGRGFDQSLIRTTHTYTTKQLHGIKGRMARKNPTSPMTLRVFSFPRRACRFDWSLVRYKLTQVALGTIMHYGQVKAAVGRYVLACALTDSYIFHKLSKTLLS